MMKMKMRRNFKIELIDYHQKDCALFHVTVMLQLTAWLVTLIFFNPQCPKILSKMSTSSLHTCMMRTAGVVQNLQPKWHHTSGQLWGLWVLEDIS